MQKKHILPIAAALFAAAAVIVVLAVPKGAGDGGEKTGVGTAAMNEDGDVVVSADALSATEVTFIRPYADSKVELLAVRDADGNAKVSLGTCQSCNGAPGAYYTQEGDHLKCNNCGLTFPLSVVEEPGAGCHPITIDDTVIREAGSDVVLDTELLRGYEGLFAQVAAH